MYGARCTGGDIWRKLVVINPLCDVRTNCKYRPDKILSPFTYLRRRTTLLLWVGLRELLPRLVDGFRSVTSLPCHYDMLRPTVMTIQGGGHSVLSNVYGLGADRVLQLRVVTPDGQLRVANACQNPDLFWALRGGGGGTFGVVMEATSEIIPQRVSTVVRLPFLAYD